MARRRRERMSEGKKNIIAGLIQEYDIKTAEDIQDTASNTPAQKAAAVMWHLRYLFIIQLFISCFNR